MTWPLRLRAGQGRVLRSESRVLALVGQEADSMLELLDPPPTAPTSMVAFGEWLTAHGPPVCPLVFIEWDDVLRVLVFGDTTVESNHPALSLLSGAGSQTWVERTIPLSDSPISVSAGAGAVDGLSDLLAGCVVASGFELMVGKKRPAALTRPAFHESTVVDLNEVTSELQLGTHLPVTASPELTVDNRLEPVVAEPESPRSFDPELTISVADFRAGLPTTEEVEDSVSPRSVGGRHTLVEARQCAAGHPNPLERSTCRICGAIVDANQRSMTVTRPSLGFLELHSGHRIPLTNNVSIGREPEIYDDEDYALVIPDSQVSRHHAEIRLDGWNVTVVDLGSRNGTFVSSEQGGDPTRLIPNTPHRLEPGELVLLSKVAIRFMEEVPGA